MLRACGDAGICRPSRERGRCRDRYVGAVRARDIDRSGARGEGSPAPIRLAGGGAPPVERIRTAVSSRLSGVSVVEAHDLSGSNEVLVSAELPGEGDLTALRQTIGECLGTVGGAYSIRGFEAIGPQIGADLRRQAL